LSPRKPRLSSEEMIRLLEENGFESVSTRGSHRKLRNKVGVTVIVPLSRDPLKIGTQTAILAQAGILLSDN
jgi:predicted RNA binding protein YcfA (HicA-like mRNA interferase family)